MSEADRRVVVGEGVELAFSVRGKGPALLMIMGLGGHRGDWGERLPALLARDHTVVAFDARGTGLSSKPREETSIGKMAEDALAVLDAADIERAHVMGMSMGGMVAMQLGLVAAQRVRSLSLVSTSAGGPSAFAPNERAMAAMTPMKNVAPEVVVRARIEAFTAPGFGEAHPAIVDAAIAASLRAPTPMYAWRAQLAAVLAHDLRAELARIFAPALVVHGEADSLVSIDDGRALAAAIPGAASRFLPALGHLLPIEAPDELASLVSEHVAAVELATR